MMPPLSAIERPTVEVGTPGQAEIGQDPAAMSTIRRLVSASGRPLIRAPDVVRSSDPAGLVRRPQAGSLLG
jgi:hypothetical protein